MKLKHILISESGVYPNMRVYFVPVGTSDREKRQKSKIVVASSKDPDIYFQQYSQSIAEFIHRLAMQLYEHLTPSGAFEAFYKCNVRHISLSEAVSLVIPANLPTSKPKSL